ncbi:MAG: WecB/TagA/CpsF family glycosyltransferase [Bacteroidota bacterium]
MDTVRILNLDIHNHRFQDFLQSLESGVVFTPNVDHLMKLQKDRAFYEVYQKADHIVCDSRIIQISSRWLPQEPIQEQIAGSDFLPAFCQYHGQRRDDFRVFLLGGTPDSVKQAAANINAKAGSEIIVGAYSPPFGFEFEPAANEYIVKQIKASAANVLAVGVGAPKQEKWIMAHRYELPQIKLFFAIGATIDFQAGLVQRSPQWISKIGLEWLHRIFQEPGRMLKRYFVDDLPYFYLLWKQKRGRYRNPWRSSS